ncbi:hypothetical protein BJG92_03550 [Arthrobacter sp. SO5]|nr:hypothetical protein [Arthrobacter sp. SO5]
MTRHQARLFATRTQHRSKKTQGHYRQRRATPKQYGGRLPAFRPAIRQEALSYRTRREQKLASIAIQLPDAGDPRAGCASRHAVALLGGTALLRSADVPYQPRSKSHKMWKSAAGVHRKVRLTACRIPMPNITLCIPPLSRPLRGRGSEVPGSSDAAARDRPHRRNRTRGSRWGTGCLSCTRWRMSSLTAGYRTGDACVWPFLRRVVTITAISCLPPASRAPRGRGKCGRWGRLRWAGFGLCSLPGSHPVGWSCRPLFLSPWDVRRGGTRHHDVRRIPKTRSDRRGGPFVALDQFADCGTHVDRVF